MKLLLEPLFQTDLFNTLELSWPRTERQAVERMPRLIFLREQPREGGVSGRIRVRLDFQPVCRNQCAVKKDRERRTERISHNFHDGLRTLWFTGGGFYAS
jgi:hypothetical protein